MGYCQMIELLQKKEKGKIVFCNSGNFYVAIGKDAVLLNNLIGLKVSCIKPEICKVGFPISSLEKYTEILTEKRYGFVVYYFDKEKEELTVLEKYEGENRNNLINENINCYICSKGIKKYKKEDKYILALSKLYEEEIENEENYKKIMKKLKEKGKEKYGFKTRTRKEIAINTKNRKIYRIYVTNNF